MKRRHYWLRLLAFFAVTAALAAIITPFLLGVLAMTSLVYPPCPSERRSPQALGLTAEPVTLAARAGGQFQAYFIPGRNGAAVIIPPGFSSSRVARLDEAAVLAEHGYAVLLYESRRCAGMGPLSLGAAEVSEVADALDYLTGRGDVDPQKIGVHGFSSAGATAILAAAHMPQLRAVVAEGGYGDFGRDALGGGGSSNPVVRLFEALFASGMRVTYRGVTGRSITQLSPVSVIGQIAPRPILLIYGSREVSLPAGRAQAAAGASAELWVVEGAGHGNYLQVAPEAYPRRVTAFFDAALLNSR